ncbi:MAG: Uma2 family endonuclease [Acidobacteriota bacterium]|nr:Uma2 family endonuclease [Acidobacteriota bacterium]
MALELLLSRFDTRKVKERKSADELPDMFDLPSDNPEEPGLPDLIHFYQPALLNATLRTDKPHFKAADMNLYYDPKHPRRFIRPDWFIAVGADPLYQDEQRRSFVMWKEPVPPTLVIEILSYGTEDEDLGTGPPKSNGRMKKYEIYRDIIKVPHYMPFSYEDNDLIYKCRLKNGKYENEVNFEGDFSRHYIEELDLVLGSWFGTYQGIYGTWLRWFEKDGTMIPTPEELVEQQNVRVKQEIARAEQASARAEAAEKEVERFRSLLISMGINPDT